MEKKIKYSKDDVLESENYKDKVDLIKALWTDDIEKSLDEVDKMMEKYLKGKVD